MAQQMKLSILIGADASGAKAGAAEAVHAIDDVSAAGKRAATALDGVATSGKNAGSAFAVAGEGATASATAITRIGQAANQSSAGVKALIEATTGLNRAAANTDMRAADLQAYGAQLDALRAKYNPVFAVISRYKAEVEGIRQANAVGAISTDEMTAAISRQRQVTLASIDVIKQRSSALADQDALYKRLAAQAREAETSDRAQANFNSSFGIGQPVTNSAAASAAVFEEQARAADELAAKVSALRAAVDPVGTSWAALNRQMAEYNELLRTGAISVEEFGRAETLARQRHEQLVQSVGGPGGANDNNTGFRRQNLGYQAFDVGQGLASGLPLPMILAQQGPQIAQAYIGTGGGMAAVKSDLAAVAGLATSAAAAIGPVGLAFGAAGLAAAAFYFLTRKETKTTDEVLEQHAANIKALGDAYGVAGEKAKEYSDTDRAIADAKATQSAADLALKQKEAVDALSLSFGQNGGYGRGAPAFTLRVDLSAFAAPFNELRGGVITADEFVKKVQQIGEAQGLQTQAQKIVLATADLQKLNKEAQKTVDIFSKIALNAAPLDPLNVFGNIDQQQSDRANRIPSQVQQLQAQIQAARLQAYAISPAEKAAAAKAAAEAQFTEGESSTVRSNRIELAEKQALISAEAELSKVQIDRGRSADASVAAAQNELSIVGQSVAVQARLRAEFEAEAQYREQIARSGGTFNQAELDALKAKAALVAQINSQVAGQKALQQQGDDISRLQLEISLVGQSAEVRAKSIAAYEVEQQIRDQGINSISREADALRAGAQARAEMQLQLERQQAAYQSLQQAEGSAIDGLVTGTGTLKDRLKSVADSALQWFQQIAVANPLKNMLTGTNLPTLTDLFSGKTASPGATSTASMTVTAGTVMINGAPLGLPGGTGNSPLGGLLNANNNQPAAANQNTDVAAYIRQAAIQRGIDPDVALKVAQSEGGLTSWNQQSNYINAAGQREQSFGPYQLYTNGGLGNKFQSQTGLDPRLAQNGPAGVDFALDQAKQNGWSSWYGARKAGISDWEGINKGQTPTATTTTTAAMSKLNQTAATTATQIDKMGTGATDASKALTDGNGSLVSAIGKASQTATQPGTPAVPAGTGPQVGGGTAGGSIFSSIGTALSGMMKGIVGLFSNIFKGVGSIFGSLFGGLFADGAAFSGGSVVKFANGGIFDKPTRFPMAGGQTGMLGEAGPEAIMPLQRGAGGKLGVAMAMPKQVRQGGGEMRVNMASTVAINVYGNGDAELHAQWREGTREAIEQNNKQWENSFPDLAEKWRANPNVRTYG